MTAVPRNTPDAPPVGDRCRTCGATRLDGRGDVLPFHGHPTCGDCREGAEGLVAEDPARWSFGPDGRLLDSGPKPDYLVDMENRSAALHQALEVGLAGLPVTVEPPTGHGFTAVVLPLGDRLHVFPPDHGNTVYLVRLFDPDRRLVHDVTGDLGVLAGFTLVDAVSAVRDLADPGTRSGATTQEAFDAHRRRIVSTETEIAAFDPDTLLEDL